MSFVLSGGILIVIIICFIIIFFLLLGIFLGVYYNKMTKSRNKVREAFSNIDVNFKKRWDLIPNLIDIVNSYKDYEQDTLTEIINLRNGSYDNLDNNNKIMLNDNIDKELNKVKLVVENYPVLKSSDNYLNLMNQLSNVEESIASSRILYNNAVMEYNTMIEMFPCNIVSKVFGFKHELMFIANENEKENIKINM